ncbi:MAG: hypothetical protein WAU68_12075 [Vitreimonas sp.]
MSRLIVSKANVRVSGPTFALHAGDDHVCSITCTPARREKPDVVMVDINLAGANEAVGIVDEQS